MLTTIFNMNKKYISVLALAVLSLPAMAQTDTVPGPLSPSQKADIGGNKVFDLEHTTGAVSVITTKTLNHRDSKNIGNDIIGQGSGLQSLQGAGIYSVQNPTFYVRGLQTLNGNNTPLILVDGIEREIRDISAEEVERVTILKDAVATALYGYKGTNGVISIETKRGKKNSREITVSYDHVFGNISNRPKFVDGYTYGLAINEARDNDGLSPMYQPWELNSLKDQTYPSLYPNVNWVDETFRNTSNLDKVSVQFKGGSDKFRYFAVANFLYHNGYIKNPNVNEGYSTQDKFSRGNIRMNLDIDLTPTTLVKVNVFGSLTENQRPGNEVDLWDMMYTVPSAAFPIKADNGLWGGSATWPGTLNPVAQSMAAAYYKNHARTLFTDLTIRQDLGMVTPGLSAQVNVAYDNYANIYENHSKTYRYQLVNIQWPSGTSAPTWSYPVDSDGAEVVYGVDSAMGTDAKPNEYDRYLYVSASVDYDRIFGDLGVYSQLKWDYDSTDPEGINNTVRRQTISWWSHLNYKNRYLLDLTLAEMGSSRLAPGTKWAFSPTVGLGWIISNESFWSNPARYLKLRATFGKLNADFLPDDNWTYYMQQYTLSGGLYPFDSAFGSSFGTTSLGRMATIDPSNEQAYKYNIGIDASPVEGLDLSVDLFKERRNHIFVTSAGKYTALLGMDAPYLNAGVVDSKGIEISADYSKTFGDFSFSVGGDLSFNKNKIIDMLEEPRVYSNLVETGHSVSQIYGLEAIGFFKNQADIDNSPQQLFSTVRPGDIKYRDVNGDGVINSNDKVAIGRSAICPEIYYNFRVGAEYKGFGLYGFFQGTGNYTAVLNTKGMYWPLINNTNISQYAYDNSWRPGNEENALFPALSSSNNANNYQTSTLWLRNRSFLKLRNLEVYYNVPKSWLSNTLKVVNGAKVYVRLVDFFAWGNVPENDPECYGVQPVDKSIAVGLSVTF